MLLFYELLKKLEIIFTLNTYYNFRHILLLHSITNTSNVLVSLNFDLEALTNHRKYNLMI